MGLTTLLYLPADQIILILGLLTFVLTLYALYLLPDFFVRFILWVLTHTLYRIRIVGQENIPLHGPALLISNHVSFVDALLIGASIPRLIRFMLHREYYDIRWLNWLFRLMKSIPISASNRRDIVHALQSARQELEQGQVVCIFAEGGISRIGHLLPFKRGFEKIVQGTDFPIIPVHLDQLWGSIFQFQGRPFLEAAETAAIPRNRLFRSASAIYRHSARSPSSRLGVGKPSVIAALQTACSTPDLSGRRSVWFSFCMADTTGTELSFGRTLIGSMLLSRWVRKYRPNDSMVGILLPPPPAERWLISLYSWPERTRSI